MKGGNFNKIMKSIDVEQIIVGILIIVLVVLVIVYVNKNNEGFNDSNDVNKPILYFFYVDWCPHCTDAKESVFGDNEKDNTKWNNNTNLSNKNNVNLVKVNCEGSDKNKALAKKYNVSAYPTVIVEANGNVANFNGNPKDGSKNGRLNTLMSNENLKNIKNGNVPKGSPFDLV